MTANEAYNHICTHLNNIYDDREGAIIARYLIEDIFNKQFWSDDNLTEDEYDLLPEIVSRLRNHEPWQYIGGKADFYGLKFMVNPSVLIPRPETEELVYMAIDVVKKHHIGSILDIGTGSGVIPVTIAMKTRLQHIYGLDVSVEALVTAQANATAHHVDINWLKSDILQRDNWCTLPKVDMVISNPPYITTAEKDLMHPNVLNHEPHLALFVKNDAMEFYEAIAQLVNSQQDEGCKVLVEINENYGQEVCDVFRNQGLKNVTLFTDLQGKDRVVVAEK